MAAPRSPARPCSDARASPELLQTVVDQLPDSLVKLRLLGDAPRLLERLPRLVLRTPVLEQVVAAEKQRAHALRWLRIRHRCDHSRVKLAPWRSRLPTTSTSRRHS